MKGRTGGMRAALTLLAILAVTGSGSAPARAQVQVDWVQDLGGVAVAVDPQHNVFTAAYDYNLAGDITVTKRDTDGALLWNATFNQTDNSKWEKATWVAADGTGHAIVSGTLMSGYSNPVNAAGILMKYSPTGQLAWRIVYETSFDGSYTKKCLVDAADNIYVLGMGSGPAGYVTKVKKFAPNGDVLWTWYDAAGIGAPQNFKLTPDGGIVISARGIIGSVNGYAKISQDGNTLWSLPGIFSLTIGDVDGDAAGNSYVVHGEYVTNGGTVVRKLSPAGETLWSNVYPHSGLRIEVGNDGRPVVCGYPNANSFGSTFFKLDPDGAVVWTNADADGPLALLAHAHLVMDADDNLYLAAGTMFEMAVCKVTSDGASAWTATTTGGYAYALALGGDGAVYVGGGDTAKLRQESPASSPLVEMDAVPSRLRVEPNPVGSHTTLRYELPAEMHVTLRIIDPAGRQVRTLVDRTESAGARSVSFPAAGLEAGTYFAVLEYGNERRTEKLTLIR